MGAASVVADAISNPLGDEQARWLDDRTPAMEVVPM